jgi:hypothetical protein
VSVLDWLKGLRPGSEIKQTSPELREFVYLDDVSVYSLLASRLGFIPHELTQTSSYTDSSSDETAFGLSAGVLKGTNSGTTSRTTGSTSQVLSKSTVQTAFGRLIATEQGALLLGTTTGAMPDLGGPISALSADGTWIIDPNTIQRGRLTEIEVELDADAIYRTAAVMGAVMDILQEDGTSLGVDPQEMAKVRVAQRILEKLLSGLVPIRGTAVNYRVLQDGARNLVVRREVAKALAGTTATFVPLIVVGVAEHRLFWKDIRRVLFTGSRYRVLGRVGQAGIRDKWTPVKLADVLRGVLPDFDSQLGQLGEATLSAISQAARVADDETSSRGDARVAASFAEHLALELGATLDEDQRALAVLAALSEETDVESVDGRRKMLARVQAAVETVVGLSATPDQALAARIAASRSFLGLPSKAPDPVMLPAFQTEQFLDTEFVAIYW